MAAMLKMLLDAEAQFAHKIAVQITGKLPENFMATDFQNQLLARHSNHRKLDAPSQEK